MENYENISHGINHGKTLRAIDLIRQAIANNPKKDFVIFTNSEAQKSYIEQAFGNDCNVVLVPIPKPSLHPTNNIVENRLRSIFDDNCMVVSRTMIDQFPDAKDWLAYTANGAAIKAYPGFEYFYNNYDATKRPAEE
jgi:hypothetical protein